MGNLQYTLILENYLITVFLVMKKQLSLKKAILLKFIMQKEKISPEQVVMVGDTENDFEAARENSIESIGVKWGYGNESHKPDRWVRSAEELFSLVF